MLPTYNCDEDNEVDWRSLERKAERYLNVRMVLLLTVLNYFQSIVVRPLSSINLTNFSLHRHFSFRKLVHPPRLVFKWSNIVLCFVRIQSSLPSLHAFISVAQDQNFSECTYELAEVVPIMFIKLQRVDTLLQPHQLRHPFTSNNPLNT